MLPLCQPLLVVSKPCRFEGAEWIFELKYDGFRALAYIKHGQCRLVSDNGHEFSSSSFVSLASSLAQIPHDGGVILDGEIACVDAQGQPRFNDLLFRRREPRSFAFDLLHLNGKDCRREPAGAAEARTQAIAKFRQAFSSGLRGTCGNARCSTLQLSSRT
jgi:bifunctional non-homologous end joining protein LigD